MESLRNLIGGQLVSSHGSEWIDVVDPATEQVVARAPAGSPHDVDAAVEAARQAQPAWSALPLTARLDLVEAIATALEEHSDELGRLECLEMGKPVTAEKLSPRAGAAALRASVHDARSYPFEETLRDGRGSTTIVRKPVGVVGLVTPWNVPVSAVLLGLGPLLLAGNTVVLKPSEKAPLSVLRMAELADLPPGVLNVVLGDHRAGAPLTEHSDVGLVHFTGSVATGRAVGAASGRRLRRSVLELGGKDPVLVDAGVDPVATARAVATGSFLNTGQICTSMERIYVHRDVADEFVDALVDEARAWTFGHGRDPGVRMGPLVDERQRSLVHFHVTDAVSRGAKVLTGGTIPDGQGYFYPATVLTGVTSDMLIMTEETFGPVAPVAVADDFDHAVQLARETSFGLAATVYSNDPANIGRAHEIPVGTVWINEWQGRSLSRIHEPAGDSGFGATGGALAFDAATRPMRIVGIS